MKRNFYKMILTAVFACVSSTYTLFAQSAYEIMKKNQDYNFNAKLFHSLAEHGINEKNFWGHSITQLVVDELKKFYDMLSEADNSDKAEY